MLCRVSRLCAQHTVQRRTYLSIAEGLVGGHVVLWLLPSLAQFQRMGFRWSRRVLRRVDLSKGGLYLDGACKRYNTRNNSWLAVHMKCVATAVPSPVALASAQTVSLDRPITANFTDHPQERPLRLLSFVFLHHHLQTTHLHSHQPPSTSSACCLNQSPIP